MRKKSMKWKRAAAFATGAVLVAASAAGGIASLPLGAAAYNNQYNLNVSHSFQEFDGWGLSLSWWATEIGDWTRTGSSGMQKREEVMEAIYGESGLNLNIARYNVGGGDNPTHTHMTDDRNTPGWKGADTVELAEGATAPEGTFTAKGGTVYKPNDRYVFEQADGSTLSWDKTPDYRQLWVLDWIQNHREEDLITEYYSNSPPYWLTQSGCSSGRGNKNDNSGENLMNDEAHNQAFVDYLLDVYEYLVGQGFQFENIQPFNESNSAYHYWAENGDQEGCHFSSAQQVAITKLLAQSMQERNFGEKYGAVYNWGDETNTNEAWSAYEKGYGIDPEAINGASRLTYHIYDYKTDTAQKMYRAARQNGQELYMSEICYTSGSVYDPDAMDTGFEYTQGMLNTIKHSGVDAYVFWQGVEDMVGQIKNGTNYGLIQGVYYTQEEAEEQGTDLAAMGLNYQDFVLSKAYYMSGQFTKYIQKGYTIVDVDDNNALAAISPDGQTLVVVKQNKDGDADSFKLNLGGFKASLVEKIYTDKTHNWAKEAVSTDGDSVIDAVNGSSVTTYVIHGMRTGGEGTFLDDSMAQYAQSLADIQANFTAAESDADTSKTYMYATYDLRSANKITATNGGDWGYFGTTNSEQKPHWMAFRFYGVGFGVVFPKKSDAGEISVWVDCDPAGTPTKTVNLRSANATKKNIVCSEEDVSGFEAGWHTVYVQSKEGTWVNFDGAFIQTTADVATGSQTLAITNAAGVDGQLKLDYTAEGYSGYEIFAETRVGDGIWERTDDALTGGSATLSVNGSRVQIRLAAVKDDEVKYSPVRVVDLLTATDGVLYFVDSGTATPDVLSTGAVLGRLQSRSDQAYGADPFTEKIWGYTNTLKSGKSGMYFYGTDEAMTSMMALENVNESALEYKFTIPAAGTYRAILGFFGGDNGWGTRTVTATVGTETKSVTLNQQIYTAEYFTLTTTQTDEEITITVTNGGNGLLSLIAITEENVKLPLYTSGASNYNTLGKADVTEITIGSDVFAAVENGARFTVYYTDGTTTDFAASDTGVSYTVSTTKIAAKATTYSLKAGDNITATLCADALPDVKAEVPYRWMMSGATVLYYNIDCGYVKDDTPPDDKTNLIGIKQSTTHDRVFGPDSTGNSWGFVGTKEEYDKRGLSYENNDNNSWSICGNVNGISYKMTGFRPNESLLIKTGGHLYKGWGVRAYKVLCNDTEVGEIKFTDDDQDKAANHIYETFECTADANGELVVKYNKSSGDNPWVGYIQVSSNPGGSVIKDPTIVADKTSVGRNDTITLRNLNANATVYVLDGNGAILYSFKPDATGVKTLDVSEILKSGVYELHFMQATEENADADIGQTIFSEDLVVDVPDFEYELSTEWIEGGRAMAVLFTPHVKRGITSFTITAPDGATSPLTDGFFYRAKMNGGYTVKLVSGGTTVVKSFTVENIDLVDIKKEFSTQAWTDGNVTVTLTPEATSGIVSVRVNDEEVTLDNGSYQITATENGEYTVTVNTVAGFSYTETVTVGNIDKTAPAVTLGINFGASGGLTLGYRAVAVSGGKLYISLDGGERKEVTESEAVSLDKEGKYEISFVNGTGAETARQVYYVTYGAEKSHLATVTVGEGGTVTVADKARAVPQTKLYRAGEDTAIASMKAEKAGKYYLEIENDGEKEIVVFSVNAPSAGIADNTKPAPSGNGNGNNGIMIAGIVVGCAALVAAGVVCTLLILKGRKKQ